METDIKLESKKADNGKYGFVDEIGNWVIPPQFDGAEAFVEGVAGVGINGKCGFINPDGSWAIPPVYDDTDFQFSEGLVWFSIGEGKFEDGEYIAPNHGYIRKDGSLAIPPIFEDVNFFSRGVAVVKFKGKYGVINHDGDWVVKPIYDLIFPSFMGGTAGAELNGKVGILNPDGSWLVPLTESELTLCPPKHAEGNWLLRDRDGNVVNEWK